MQGKGVGWSEACCWRLGFTNNALIYYTTERAQSTAHIWVFLEDGQKAVFSRYKMHTPSWICARAGSSCAPSLCSRELGQAGQIRLVFVR